MTSLFILVPFCLLIILNLPLKFLKKRAAFWLVGLLFLAQTILAISVSLNRPGAIFYSIKPFFNFALLLDSLAFIMLIIIGIVGLVSLLVASGMITEERERFNFINLLLISIIGMNTAVLAVDIFSLYVFVEVTAMALFILIALDKGKHAVEGAFKYIFLSAIASVFMLSGIAFFLLSSGGVSFSAISMAFSLAPNSLWLKLGMTLFLCGLLIKSGVMPFHGWLPDAYSAASAPVSVLLAGVVTKVSGVYVLLRLYGSVFIVPAAIQNTLLFLGAFSIVLAALMALAQDNLKRMLAYSSISQVGYIVLALGCGTPLGFAGAVFHFFNHAIFKSLLFVNSASLEKQLGTNDMNAMSGYGSKMPVTGVTSLMGLLSCAGVPPLAGFWSKLVIIIALFSSGKFVYAAIALLASVITLAYFLSLERRVFFGPVVATQLKLAKPSGAINFCEISLAVITVAGGIGAAFILVNWIVPLTTLLR